MMKLDHLESIISQMQSNPHQKKHYRNSDLNDLFDLAANTIIKYRETGVLPYTTLGGIYYYEIDAINDILEKNKVSIRLFRLANFSSYLINYFTSSKISKPKLGFNELPFMTLINPNLHKFSPSLPL